jgi:two-component system sensor histidine kinase ChvG
MGDSFRQKAQSFSRSLAVKIIFVAIIFLIVPVIFYRLFQMADAQQTQLLVRTVEEKGNLIASVLEPHLLHFQQEPPDSLQHVLDPMVSGGVNIRILLRPINSVTGGFSYIASAPSVSADYLNQERQKLIEMGVFNKLAPSCDGDTNTPGRFTNPAGKTELLTSITPLHIGESCWLIVTSQTAEAVLSTSIGQPVWQTPTVHIAAIVYTLSAMLVGWIFLQMWRNIDRFRTAARMIRVHGSDVSFREMNTIPELTGVAEDFDALVRALNQSKKLIVQLAEENAHALKAPLAVISQALEPLKRAVPSANLQALRSVDLIERSTARLDLLVSAARDLEQASAEVIYQKSEPMDLSQHLARLIEAYEPTLTAEGKHLDASIEQDVFAYATEESMEAIVENLLENAASFTEAGGKVEVSLRVAGEAAQLTIADNGPGVAPEFLPKIFERNFSVRDDTRNDASSEAERHYGLGLWIVQRNVTGLGGSVAAENRDSGGFSVTVTLRAA